MTLCFGLLCFALVGCQQNVEQTQPESDQLEVRESSINGPFYVLVIGNDSRTGTTEINKAEYADGAGRSDTTMLVRVDPDTYQIGIVTIPRDTKVTINGQNVKFNQVYQFYGMEETLNQVELLTGVRPQFYMDMGFVDFEDFINQIGGVTANVPINMHLVDIVSGGDISLSAGSQDLDGAEALVLARSRKQYANDLDACRQIQDRQIVQAVIQKVLADPDNAQGHIDALVNFCDTDIPVEDLTEVVNDFVAHADEVAFVSGTGPYAGGIDPSDNLFYTTRDEATWQQVIAAVEAGNDPATVVALPTVAQA